MSYNRFLTKAWNDAHLRQIKNKAGNRYTPKLNVDLPISEVFDGISRSAGFYYSIRTHYGKLRRGFDSITSKHQNSEIQTKYELFSKTILVLMNALSGLKEYNTAKIPWKNIAKWSQNAEDSSWKLLEEMRGLKDKAEKTEKPDGQKNGKSPSERLSSDMHYLYETQRELHYFREFAESVAAKLSNTPFLFLSGLAGTGKTHLLCDVAERRFKEPKVLPAVLVFGEFVDGKADLWKQIAAQIGLSLRYDKSKILQNLNMAGKRNKARSLLIIDAINETRPMISWKHNLKTLVSDIKKYPNVALVVSVRSGFENYVSSKTVSKLFVKEEHQGFRFREWEAVTKFFKEFALPLPEIPLLMPEFQNPLFLLLFCKAFERRKSVKKQVFRGHEGATYIFENFVDSVSKKIEKRFGISSGPGKNIWDKVIEQVAAEMVEQNKDRVPEERLKEIVNEAYPSLSHKSLLTEIEKNLLLIKVPRYTADHKQDTGFDYRFPFQKFSDHLIGRFIFKKYRSSGKTPKEFFAKDTETGKFLSNSWNLGIIEALSIQCPEQLKGLEFYEIAPYLQNYLLVDAFIESIIWRNPEAFSKDLKNVLAFINKKVIYHDPDQSKLRNALLSVASIPKHPFNAEFLHRNLARMPMPKRDGSWSIFLHDQYKEKRSVDRLIEWGWSGHNKRHIKDEPIKLCSIALAWFLTTPNRSVRDKATKALVELLTDRLSVIVDLAELFKAVDDPYVVERLYAVAYGCSLRNRTDKAGLKKLGQWFYDNVFKTGKPPIDILIRDYARGVVELAVRRGLITVDMTKVEPPYGSKWPRNIPSEKFLKDKYYPKDFTGKDNLNHEYLSIWSSVMSDFGSLADFGRYTVNSALDHWSGRRLGAGQISKKKQFEDFNKSLGKKKLDLFNRINPFFGVNLAAMLGQIKVRITFEDKSGNKIDPDKLKKQEKEEEARHQERIMEFKESLSTKERKFYEKKIEPYLSRGTQITDPLDRIDTGLGQRWLFNRVVQLGWSDKLHGVFDKYVNRGRADRSEHKPERIGKKYQWIAFHELLALVADNFQFKGDSWNEGPPAVYQGPWQLSIRDIDPSCTLKEEPRKTSEVPILNNGAIYNAWKKKATASAWLRTKDDLPDPKLIIEMEDSNGVRWLMIEGYINWQEETPPEHEKYRVPTRNLWYIIKSYLVKRKEYSKAYEWAVKQDFFGRWMPESNEFYNVYLAEYPDSEAFLPYDHSNKWTKEGRFSDHRMPIKVFITDEEYQSSGSSIDCSTEGTIHVKLPTKLIIDKMKLVQKYTDGRFFDKNGILVAFDPTIFGKDIPRCLIIRKDALCEFLEKNRYGIIWTLLGEKNMLGGSGVGQPLGWPEIDGAFRLDGSKKITGRVKIEFKKPQKGPKS